MDKVVGKSLGKRLARARQDLGIRGYEIGPALGTDLFGISRYEVGARPLPHGKTLADYIRALEQLTGKSAQEIGLADLLESATAA